MEKWQYASFSFQGSRSETLAVGGPPALAAAAVADAAASDEGGRGGR